jgi:hypothetical protein
MQEKQLSIKPWVIASQILAEDYSNIHDSISNNEYDSRSQSLEQLQETNQEQSLWVRLQKSIDLNNYVEARRIARKLRSWIKNEEPDHTFELFLRQVQIGAIKDALVTINQVRELPKEISNKLDDIIFQIHLQVPDLEIIRREILTGEDTSNNGRRDFKRALDLNLSHILQQFKQKQHRLPCTLSAATHAWTALLTNQDISTVINICNKYHQCGDGAYWAHLKIRILHRFQKWDSIKTLYQREKWRLAPETLFLISDAYYFEGDYVRAKHLSKGAAQQKQNMAAAAISVNKDKNSKIYLSAHFFSAFGHQLLIPIFIELNKTHNRQRRKELVVVPKLSLLNEDDWLVRYLQSIGTTICNPINYILSPEFLANETYYSSHITWWLIADELIHVHDAMRQAHEELLFKKIRNQINSIFDSKFIRKINHTLTCLNSKREQWLCVIHVRLNSYANERNSHVDRINTLILEAKKRGAMIYLIGEWDALASDAKNLAINAVFKTPNVRELDLYMVMSSDLLVLGESGPSIYSLLFGTPSILVNYPWGMSATVPPNSLFLPRRVTSEDGSNIPLDTLRKFRSELEGCVLGQVLTQQFRWKYIDISDQECIDAIDEMASRLKCKNYLRENSTDLIEIPSNEPYFKGLPRKFISLNYLKSST